MGRVGKVQGPRVQGPLDFAHPVHAIVTSSTAIAYSDTIVIGLVTLDFGVK